MSRDSSRRHLGLLIMGALVLAGGTASAQDTQAEPPVAAPAPAPEVAAQPEASIDVQALGSLDPGERVIAVRALGDAGDQTAVPHLTRVLGRYHNDEGGLVLG